MGGAGADDPNKGRRGRKKCVKPSERVVNQRLRVHFARQDIELKQAIVGVYTMFIDGGELFGALC